MKKVLVTHIDEYPAKVLETVTLNDVVEAYGAEFVAQQHAVLVVRESTLVLPNRDASAQAPETGFTLLKPVDGEAGLVFPTGDFNKYIQKFDNNEQDSSKA